MDLTKLDLNTDTMIKNVKLVELNINAATFFLCNKTLKMISQNTNVYVVTKIINTRLMKS